MVQYWRSVDNCWLWHGRYAARLFDTLSRYHPGIDLHTYVDDVDLASQQSEAHQAADSLAAEARALADLLERALLLQVAYYMCVRLASSPAVEKAP